MYSYKTRIWLIELRTRGRVGEHIFLLVCLQLRGCVYDWRYGSYARMRIQTPPFSYMARGLYIVGEKMKTKSLNEKASNIADGHTVNVPNEQMVATTGPT